MKPTLFVVLDIETTMRKRIAFDVAWTITDRRGNDFGAGSYVLREAFALDTPYFKEKLGHYFDDTFTGNITPASITEVRDIFTSRKQYWSGGSKITVFVLDSDTPAHQAFCRQVLNMFPYQLDRLWNQIIYSGQGERPKTVESESALINAVASTPGAIGYIYDEATSVNVHEVVIP